MGISAIVSVADTVGRGVTVAVGTGEAVGLGNDAGMGVRWQLGLV